MASLQNIRYGVEARLKTISGLSTSHTIPSGVAACPYAYVTLPASQGAPLVDYDETYGNGSAMWFLQVVVLVGQADSGIGQDSLDPFLSNDAADLQSIFQAIMADTHLAFNGVPTAQDTRVRRAHSYGKHVIGSTPFIGCAFDLEIISSP